MNMLKSTAKKKVDNKEMKSAVDENKLSKNQDLKILNTEYKKVKLTDCKDKIVIFDFGETWCGPCWESIPDFMEIQI